MFGNKNIIIISPHIDDSFYSLGFLIKNLYNKGNNITIINIFIQTNFLLNKLDSDAQDIRIKEEKKLLKKYPKIQIYNLGFKDAIIRGYSKKTLFSLQNLMKDKEIVFLLKEKINSFLQKKVNYCLFLPIGYGNHIDHIITTESIVCNIDEIYFYEDLPYAFRNTKNDFAIYKTKSLKKYILYFIKQNDIESHIENIKYYESQLSQKHYQEIKEYLYNRVLGIWKKKYFSIKQMTGSKIK